MNLAMSDIVWNILSESTNYRQFKLIKAIFFNKNKQHNWFVPWHQDKTIAVKQKAHLAGYKNWTIKQGVSHVQPPIKILNGITTIRIALDSNNNQNGALKIIPRSHTLGILKQEDINCIVTQQQMQFCLLDGDILMMHPLILHSSDRSIIHSDCRIIHLEYCSANLPQELTWHY